MSLIGDELESFDSEFAKYFEDDLEITNYTGQDTATGPEEWDDPDDEQQETADSPIATTGQIDPPQQMTGRTDQWDRDVKIDVLILLPDDVTVSDGDDDDLPYPSTVKHLPTGETYRISSIHDEGNGRLLCAAVSEGN